MERPDYWQPLSDSLASVARQLGLDPEELKVHESVNKPVFGPSRWVVWMRIRYDPAGLIAQGSSAAMTKQASFSYDRADLARVLLPDLAAQIQANGGRTTRRGAKRARKPPKKVRRRHHR